MADLCCFDCVMFQCILYLFSDIVTYGAVDFAAPEFEILWFSNYSCYSVFAGSLVIIAVLLRFRITPPLSIFSWWSRTFFSFQLTA